MTDTRHEIILRLPNLSPASSPKVIAVLEPMARRLRGRLSVIERNHANDGSAMHVSRRRIV